MYNVDISSDIEDVMKDVDDFFNRDIPFTLARSMNDTMFDVRRRVVNSTFDKTFNVRNSRFPNTLWRVDKIITGGKYSTSFRGFKGGQIDNMFVTLRQTLDRGYMEDHVAGGKKTPRGSSIAIPKNGNSMRNKGGSIRKRDKPFNITNKKDHFLMRDKAGRKRFIAKRTKGSKSLEIKYTFTKAAQIKPKFRFYEDAFDTIERVLLNHWATQMTIAIDRSRFHPG
jgi:hypothetical protein